MNVVITLDQFQKNNIYFKPAIENNIIEDSKFVKIIYSNDLITLNSLFIYIPLINYSIESYFKKHKYSFDIDDNKNTLDKIFTIEEHILNMYTSNKCKKHIIKQSLSNGFLKIYPNYMENQEYIHTDTDTNANANTNTNTNTNTDNCKEFIIKISGIWETNDEYGVNYKITLQ